MQSDLREAAQAFLDSVEPISENELGTTRVYDIGLVKKTKAALVAALASTPAPCPASEGARQETFVEAVRSSGMTEAQQARLMEFVPHAGLREAWEAGFRLCRSYGDNSHHCTGEQREQQWQAFLDAHPTLATSPKPDAGKAVPAGHLRDETGKDFAAQHCFTLTVNNVDKRQMVMLNGVSEPIQSTKSIEAAAQGKIGGGNE